MVLNLASFRRRPKFRVWRMPRTPGGVRTVRDANQKIWRKMTDVDSLWADRWRPDDPFNPNRPTWYQLLEYGPLTEVK